MRIPEKLVIILAIILGIILGLLWLRFGDHSIEPIFGQFITWYILPETLALTFSLLFFFIDFSEKTPIRIANSILLGALLYLSFWVPLSALILGLILTGGTM